MRTLVIETASEACSVALFEGAGLVAHAHKVLGRGHAEALVPMVAGLPEKGRADRILASLGPGSFTGVRIGIATARALGVAWKAQVLGYPTLSLIAAIALQDANKVSETGETAGASVTVCINGGHGEWFVQNFGTDGAEDEVRSLTPEAAKDACRHSLIAGNRAEQLGELFGGQKNPLNLLPDASKALAIDPAHFTANLSPIYGRAPDAVPQRVTPV